MRGGKDWIAKLQQDEITRTCIQSLKVRFNSVFGYYIEVTKAISISPCPLYPQTNHRQWRRFITPELKEMEGKILGAEERGVKLEYELFQRVREEILAASLISKKLPPPFHNWTSLAGFAEIAASKLLPSSNRRRRRALHSRWAPSRPRTRGQRRAFRSQRHTP